VVKREGGKGRKLVGCEIYCGAQQNNLRERRVYYTTWY
jgi:hypothetical protein